MKVICLSEEAFYELLDKVMVYVRENEPLADTAKWASETEAMQLLGISSKTTLQKLRDNGDIEYSQPMKKVIRYNKESILQYLEKHKHRKF